MPSDLKYQEVVVLPDIDVSKELTQEQLDQFAAQADADRIEGKRLFRDGDGDDK